MNIKYIYSNHIDRFLRVFQIFLLCSCWNTSVNAALNDGLISENLVSVEEDVRSPEKKILLKGKVTDRSGLPLIGVNVVIQGSVKNSEKNKNLVATELWNHTIGTVTDVNGNFVLSVPDSKNDLVLLFTYVGMESVTYKVNDKKFIKVVMKEDSRSLEQVVVTGMEVIKKDHMTGSATVVTAKDLKMQGITSIDRILEGMVAGLNSTTISGAPGARSKITIRGENNLSGNTEPLWIVDGLPMMSGVPENTSGDYAGAIMQDGVGNIMPDDIESISILKDASAAAVYGARAANGVIIITTKKGFRSKTQVNYSGSYECGIAPKNNLQFMNASEKISYEEAILDHFGLQWADNTGRAGYLYKKMKDGYMTSLEYQHEKEKMQSYNTNWFDVLFRTAHSQQHNISLRGGSDELTYYTSVSFQQKNGILRSNKYNSAGILMKLDYRPIKNLIMALDVSANTRKNRDHASAIDPFKYAMFANPYERPYDDDGNYAPDLSYVSNNYTTKTASGYKYNEFNILKELNETKNTQDGLDAQITLDVRYEPIPGLTLESVIRKGVSHSTERSEINEKTYTSWVNEQFGRAAFPGAALMPSQYDNGELKENAGKSHNWSIRNQIDYSFNIKEDHLFSILLANEVMSRRFNNFGYKSPIYNAEYNITGVPNFDTNVSYENIKSTIGNMFHTDKNQDRTVSFLGTFRYGYKDRYIFNFNYRVDGADVIGDAKRYTPLWSAGLRYNMHHEKFFKNNILSELSFRASFGYTGNIDRSAYPFSTISFGSDTYQGNRIVNKITFPNPSIKWEKKRDFNCGMDASFWDGRIGVTVDYYSNKITDILETIEVPASTGRTNNTGVKLNGGVIENRGLEFYANVKWINRNDWAFSTSFNIAKNKNVIKKSRYSYDSYQEAIQSSVSKGGILNINGKETGSIYGWKTCGVNPKTGNPRYFLTEEGKRQYAAFLDSWDSYSDSDKERLKDVISSLTTVPDYVDYVRNENQLMPFMAPSMQYLGRSNPKYVGGFNTYLRYKGFEFSTSWTFKTGHLIPNFNDFQNAPRNGIRSSMAAIGYSRDLAVSATNREKKYLNFWKAPGDVTNVARFVSSGNDYWSALCLDSNYSKGDYLRMTNLSISYRLPHKFVENINMKNLTIGFSTRNLLTFTKYRGLDVGSGGAFTYPVSREFNIKVTANF